MVAGQRHMWGGNIYVVALHDFNVGLYSRGSDAMKTKDYQIFQRRSQCGRKITAHIVAETQGALIDAINYYRGLYRFHDAGVPYNQTALTCDIDRRAQDGG